jgi:uncharacterized repeat protein (TIGR01451 family)
MFLVSVVDTVLGTLTGSFSASLAPGASETKTFTYTILATDPDPLPNTVTVTYKDALNVVKTADASHSVDILHPEILVTKTADADKYHVGDPITYTIVVENKGDCPLYNVMLSDTTIGWSAGPITLAKGASMTYTVIYTITGSEADPFKNIVYATGEDILGGLAGTVSDDDDEEVDILHPAIQVVKTGPTYVRLGETITYTYKVTNEGDCPLDNIILTDDKVSTITYVSGDDGDWILEDGEEWIYTASWVVPSYGLVTNTATVYGTDELDLTVSDQDSWTVRVMPKSKVTDSGLCEFDRDSDISGRQFRLIFTQDPKNPGAFKLTASNPGQFYFNVFYYGTEGSTVTMNIKIPYPFVTHGAQPIHVYSDVTYGPCGCFVPMNELSGFSITGTDTVTPSGALGIELNDYSPEAFGSYVTITVTGQAPATELIYVTIHLDYGLKHTVGYQKNANEDAIDYVTEAILIPNLGDYTFSVNGALADEDTVQNQNAFKRNPGFGGLVTDAADNPVEGYIVKVELNGIQVGITATTDEDGFYFIYYKHKGKRATFDVKLFDDTNTYVTTKSVELKANKFAEVSFQLP